MTAAQKLTSPDFVAARFSMVESQIRPNKVVDERILKAMGTLPREMFVPPDMAGIAYIDEDVQIAPGRYLLEPMVLARLLQEAQIKPEDRVFNVASATGYSTAVIASMVRVVNAVEIDGGLRKLAVENLNRLQIKNADIQPDILIEGAPQASYDVILINGGVEFLPDALTNQLAEGGRLVAVVREYDPSKVVHTGQARLYQKINGAISYRDLFDANVKLLPGFEKPKGFRF